MDVVTLALAKKYADSVSGGLTVEEVNSLPDVGKDGTLYVVEEIIYDEQGNSSTINKLYIYSESKFIPLDGSDIETISPSFDVESINITYAELVSLRDNSQLVPNTQYRIIDYVTMVSEDGAINNSVKTESAGHAFDIIVIATSNNELSENALATLHEGDEYFTQDELSKWQLKYSLDNDKDKYAWAYNTNVYVYEEFKTTISVDDNYIVLNYSGNKEYNGVIYPCWGTEEQIKALSLHYEGNENAFVDIVGAEGKDMYGGVVLNLHGLYSNNEITDNYISGEFNPTSQKIIVFKGEIGKGVIYYMKDDKNNACPYDFKNILYVTGSDTPGFIYNQWGTNYTFTRDTSLDVEGYYGWRCNSTPQSWSNDYCYTTVEVPSTDMVLYSDTSGAELSFGGTIESVELGEGFVKLYTFSYEDVPGIRIIVNEDNILFKRNSSLDSNGYYGWESNNYPWYAYTKIYTTTETPSSNTILYSSTEGEEIDSSSYEFIWASDVSQILDMSTINLGDCYYNSMKECVGSYAFGTLKLNFNIFKCVDGDMPNIKENKLSNDCSSNTFGNDCFNNIFGIHCQHNTFGNDCCNNTFGKDCDNNTFMGSCEYNTFGKGCYTHTFGIHCYRNTFGNYCHENTFGNDCQSNTFGDSCWDNTFGNLCDNNTFGGDSVRNTFGNSCDNNTFGENCCFNTFGNSCNYNIFGDNYYYNDFGNTCHHNTFGRGCSNNTFEGKCEYNIFGNSCQHNTLGDDCYSNTFEDGCYRNTFGNSCNTNTFMSSCYENTFGNDCQSNTFGDNCYSNTFGNSCFNNTFGDNCNNNTFGNLCHTYTFGDNCDGNTFGDGCNNNTFGDGYYRNTFGNDCDNNTFGHTCYSNTFGDNCHRNEFGNYCHHITFGDENGTIDFCRLIQLGNNCEYLYINSLDTEASSDNQLQNVIISSNTKGTNNSNRLTITIPDRNLEGYEIGISTYNLQGQQLTLPTYPTDTENKNYILQLSNGTLRWTLLDDGDTGEY